jgi:hypothetical protein
MQSFYRISMQGVHSLWILERQTGICLFEQTFEGSSGKVDADLIGGFLSAISKFCEELVGEEIRLIETPSMRILYHGAEKFIVVLLLENTVIVPVAETMLKEISLLFTQKYATYLETGQLANVAVFNDFAAEIEHRFERKATCFIHYMVEQHTKKGEKLENIYEHLKVLMEKRRKAIKCVPCQNDANCKPI